MLANYTIQGEMLLLIAINFHAGQLAAVGDLVQQTLSMKLTISSTKMNRDAVWCRYETDELDKDSVPIDKVLTVNVMRPFGLLFNLLA